MTIDELIAKLEAASGPDRELDAEIMFDLYAKPVGKHDDGGPRGYLWPEDNPSWSFGGRFPGKDRAWFAKVRRGHEETLVIERDGALVLMNSLRIPKLTASLDAALSLVPEGWTVQALAQGPVNRRWEATLFTMPHPEKDWRTLHSGKGMPTPALALCIASLKARR